MAKYASVLASAGRGTVVSKKAGWEFKRGPVTWVRLSNGNRVNSIFAYWNCKVGQMYPDCSKYNGKIMGK